MDGGAGTTELDQGFGKTDLEEGDETTLLSVNDDIVPIGNGEILKGFDGPEPDSKAYMDDGDGTVEIDQNNREVQKGFDVLETDCGHKNYIHK